MFIFWLTKNKSSVESVNHVFSSFATTIIELEKHFRIETHSDWSKNFETLFKGLKKKEKDVFVMEEFFGQWELKAETNIFEVGNRIL